MKTASIRLATWNLNNRVGKVRFRPEAAHAAVALDADFIVFTEYFPLRHHRQFCQVLAESGGMHQLISDEPDDPDEKANRTLIASRLPLERDGLALPEFDRQFPANTVAAHFPTLGLRVLGLRVPCYKPVHRLRLRAWEWLEAAAGSMREGLAVILGDLNIRPLPACRGVGACFRKILDSGWERAGPDVGSSYFGQSGARSEIDHVLVTPRCTIRDAKYVTSLPSFNFAGTPDALSDHAALVGDIDIH